MKKYFYMDGTHNLGPFTIDELRERRITRETKVWYQELGDWKPAGEAPELDDLFRFSPPPPPAPPSPAPSSQATLSIPPKNYLVESILVTLFCCLPFGIAGIVNASKVESMYYSGNHFGALDASNKAKKWTMAGFWTGLICGILYVIFLIVMSVVGGLSSAF